MRSDVISVIAGQRGSGKTTLAKTLISGLTRVIIYDPMHEYNPAISYRPTTDSIEEFEKVAGHVWDTGNTFFVVDEAERYLVNNTRLPINTFKIINSGRHRNIGLLLVTRRIAELHKSPFSLAEQVYLFHLFAPNDIRYIKEFYDGADYLRRLNKYEYVIFP